MFISLSFRDRRGIKERNAARRIAADEKQKAIVMARKLKSQNGSCDSEELLRIEALTDQTDFLPTSSQEDKARHRNGAVPSRARSGLEVAGARTAHRRHDAQDGGHLDMVDRRDVSLDNSPLHSTVVTTVVPAEIHQEALSRVYEIEDNEETELDVYDNGRVLSTKPLSDDVGVDLDLEDEIKPVVENEGFVYENKINGDVGHNAMPIENKIHCSFEKTRPKHHAVQNGAHSSPLNGGNKIPLEDFTSECDGNLVNGRLERNIFERRSYDEVGKDGQIKERKRRTEKDAKFVKKSLSQNELVSMTRKSFDATYDGIDNVAFEPKK